jgi:GDP-L-fucose synthase
LKILVFGSSGLVGSSIIRFYSENKTDYTIIESTRKDTDLFSFQETNKLIQSLKPNLIINAAAHVGGIHANNTQRTEFILNNLKINMNILESVINLPQTKVINLGSSCIYPLESEIPISETSLMTGKLEPTNSPYAMAKLTAIEIGDALSKQYGIKILNLMPTNLYGPNDNFSHQNSHVIPGLISRMHNAKIKKEKEFYVWGTGKPLREFLYVDDLAECINFLINQNKIEGLLNVGSGEEVSISNLVILIQETIGYDGKILFDSSMPDGNPRKLLNSSNINNLGWKPKTNLEVGLKKTYEWYVKNQS